MPVAKGLPPKKLNIRENSDEARVRQIFELFRRSEPNPKGDLNYLNNFTLLVAVVLSAQATDAGVNRATKALFQIAGSPEKMVELGEDRLREMIKSIGLFRTKARNVLGLAKILIDSHAGAVPQSRSALEQLPGVGRKTANVVMNIAFGIQTIAVDTHVFRVSNRIPLARGKSPLEVELGLERIIPAEFLLHAHHWLILHGRYICKARSPACFKCVIFDYCSYEYKTSRNEGRKTQN